MRKSLLRLSPVLIFVSIAISACNPDDLNAPTITLLGGNPQVIVYQPDSVWRDPGYSALDAIEGPVAVTASGVIRLDSAGIQYITYQSSDGSGNTATVLRTVIVDAAPYLNGAYKGSDVNDEGSIPEFSDTLKLSDTSYNLLTCKHFGNLIGGALQIRIAGQSLSIPSQTLVCGNPSQTFRFEGSGTFSDSNIQIQYIRTDSTHSISGSVSYLKQ